MKKVLIFVFLFGTMIMFSGVYAAVNNTNSTIIQQTTGNAFNSQSGDANTAIDKGYQCLENQVKNKSRLTLEESIFILLAIGDKGKALETIKNEESGTHCWPKSACTLRETARVALAYNRIGKNTDDIEKWLLARNSSAIDLSWYLEVDIQNRESSQCTIRYDNRSYSLSILNDMTLSGNLGSCLNIPSPSYWPRISNGCLDKTFEVSCDKDFITTLLYKKTNGETVYVSYDTHSAPALGTTEEKVKSKCFRTGSSCDYEGSLWAALALEKTGNDVNEYIPYLAALAEDNIRFFPSAFLYILTGGDDQYSQIIQSQKRGQYWQVGGGTQNYVYYDTSLAMLALLGSSATELQNAQNYLINIQGRNGCWNNDNLRDTAFILYSGWPRDVPQSGGGTGVGSVGTDILCGTGGKGYCGNRDACLESGGISFLGYQCTKFAEICCSIDVKQQTCTQKSAGKGVVCPSNNRCTGSTEQAADGTCCLGGLEACEEIIEENQCELSGGNCRSTCDEDIEKASVESCISGAKICCMPKPSGSSGGGIGFGLIFLLIILIVLVVLAIIFRDNIRLFWFKYKGRLKTTPVTRPGSPGPAVPALAPRGPPRPPFSPTPIRRSGFGQARLPIRPNASQRDKEMEETLRKLREMSK